MDLSASGAVQRPIDGFAIIEHLRSRYEALWRELTDLEEFGADEMWRIERRVERLNDLGFDVDELDIVTDLGGDTIRIQPKVVDLGHHTRELRDLTGMTVEDNQARRILNDIASFAAHYDLGREDRHVVASRWMHEIFEPIMAMIPPDATGKLEPAEIFHEILEHRWYLSEQAGYEVNIHATARDYIDRVPHRQARRGDHGAGVTGSHSPTCHVPLVRSRTHCRPTGRPSAYVTRLTSASRRGLLPSAKAYAAPPVVPLVQV